MTTIMGVRLGNRNGTATEFQQVLTDFGCIIKTRIGLHEATNNVCAPHGLIILEVVDDSQMEEFKNALSRIPDTQIQTMKFS